MSVLIKWSEQKVIRMNTDKNQWCNLTNSHEFKFLHIATCNLQQTVNYIISTMRL